MASLSSGALQRKRFDSEQFLGWTISGLPTGNFLNFFRSARLTAFPTFEAVSGTSAAASVQA